MKRGLTLLAGVMLAGSAAAAGDGAEARAYMSLSFGGNADALKTLHYGLQVTNSVMEEDLAFKPQIFSMDFTHRGFDRATLVGMPVTRTMLRLNQDEATGAEGEATEEVVEEEAPWYDFTEWGWVGWGITAVVVAGGWYYYDQSQDDDDDDAPPADDGGGDCLGIVDPITGECII